MNSGNLPEVERGYIDSISSITPFCISDLAETDVRDRLCMDVPDARVEVEGIHGPIDIVSYDEVIEVKHVLKYTHAVGQVIGHAKTFPDKRMRIHLFGIQEDIEEKREKACTLCEGLGIVVTFQVIDDSSIINKA